jgi:hypothetical protein
MSAENPSRRAFFRQAIGTVLAVAAAPKLPTLSALAPIIEIGEPLHPIQDVPNLSWQRPRSFTGRVTEYVVDHLACLAQELGIPENDLRALIALHQHIGFLPQHLTDLLWRLDPDDSALTGWTHHAIALSEVGKP